jgi:predicted component of type VI protein secretion system
MIPSYAVSKVIKLLETESRMVALRGWGEEKRTFSRAIEFLLQNEKFLRFVVL